MFVVPCKYIEQSTIRECVDSILKYHPEEKVMIVDSFSEDDSYLKQFKDYERVDIFDQKNSEYPPGALIKVMKSCDEKSYTLIHDSTVMLSSIQSFIDDEVEARPFWWYVEAFPWFAHQPWVGKYIIDVLNKSKYEIPDMQKQFYAVPFHHCTITNSMAKKILDSGIGDNFYLRNKWDDHAWQRLLGIIFAQENYPANKHSIIGESRPETDHSNNKYANKMFLNRDVV